MEPGESWEDFSQEGKGCEAQGQACQSLAFPMQLVVTQRRTYFLQATKAHSELGSNWEDRVGIFLGKLWKAHSLSSLLPPSPKCPLLPFRFYVW